jgi:hypothetical protein
VLVEHRRAVRQREQVERLRAAARAPVRTLPFVFAYATGGELLERLAEELAVAPRDQPSLTTA